MSLPHVDKYSRHDFVNAKLARPSPSLFNPGGGRAVLDLPTLLAHNALTRSECSVCLAPAVFPFSFIYT